MAFNQDATDPEHLPIGVRSAALAILTAAIWGGTPVAVRFSVVDLPPVAVAGMRFALATVFMLVWCRWEGTSIKLSRSNWWLAVIAGVLLFVQISLFTIGIHLSNASHGTLLINTYVLWVVLIDHFVTRQHRFGALQLSGLFLAAVGAALVLAARNDGGLSQPGQARDSPSLIGDVLVIASAVVLGVKITFTKYAVARMPPSRLILWHNIVGVMLFAGYSYLLEAPRASGLTTAAMLGIAYQGILVAGLCFALQAHLLRRHSASRLAVFSFATPVFGILFAVIFRDDQLSSWLYPSLICVAGGIWLVNRQPVTPRQRGVKSTS